jgi:hypothetical protein
VGLGEQLAPDALEVAQVGEVRRPAHVHAHPGGEPRGVVVRVKQLVGKACKALVHSLGGTAGGPHRIDPAATA